MRRLLAIVSLLASPALAVDATVPLGWNPVQHAIRYELQYANDLNADGEPVGGWDAAQTAEATTTEADIVIMETWDWGLTFTARVRGCNPAGCGPWSEPSVLRVWIQPTGTTRLYIRTEP